MFSSLLIILASFAGFILSFYIHMNKKKAKKMICPMKGNCSNVVNSQYSKFFGVPVELLGMLYYGIVLFGYVIVLTFADMHLPLLSYSLLLATGGAFLFSGYLTFIQVFTIRQICTWCFTSAGLSTLIFIVAYTFSLGEVAGLLQEYKPVIVIAHAMATALGLGAATLADFFFFKFLKDYKISEKEAQILDHISQFIWLMLGVIVLTGIGLFLPIQGQYLESSKFIAKMIIVSVIVVNGAFLNLVVAPKLVKISFDKKHEHHHKKGELRRSRRLAFSLGPISIVSWYSAFILGSVRSIPLTAAEGLTVYGVLVLIAILAGQVIETFFVRHATKTGSTISTQR